MILMWHHPKYYQELKRIRKQFEKEQADKRASEQAIQETVPHNDIEEANEQGSEQASDQASDEDASKQRWMCSQSLIAREGVSRWSTSRPGIELLS